MTEPNAAAARANIDTDRAADRKGRRFDLAWVFSSVSIFAKCKTAPALVLVLAMLKV
jgi:hypothetical protein